MKKLRQLIYYFIVNSHKKLGKTRIVKMIYMFEYYHVQTYCKQYTKVKFVRYNYGPYSSDIEKELNHLVLEGIINREECLLCNGKKAYLHSSSNMDIVDNYILDKDKRYIANKVIMELENKKYDDMINIVYSTPPMENIINKEEIDTTKLYCEVLDMNRHRPIKKYSMSKIEAARKRLDKSSKGSDEEYYNQILKEKNELDNLRRRANSCLLK